LSVSKKIAVALKTYPPENATCYLSIHRYKWTRYAYTQNTLQNMLLQKFLKILKIAIGKRPFEDYNGAKKTTSG
jgi:hypothetical protein